VGLVVGGSLLVVAAHHLPSISQGASGSLASVGEVGAPTAIVEGPRRCEANPQVRCTPEPVEGCACAHNVRSMTTKRSRKRVASVREYIASKPKEYRASLEAVRRAILKALPNAQEGLAYQMPAYTLNGVGVLYFAGWKSHYSLYPASDALVEAFAKELSPYERSKGTLKFPLSEPVPVRLIERIAKFRARQLTTRTAGTGRRKGGQEGQVDRIRRICAGLPSAFEKMSHGTPCFFVEQGKGCFAMFSEHHRDDGRPSLWVPVADGLQPLMIEESPDIYFYPRYVGAGGWVGILLDQIADDALESHLREARRIIASKRKRARSRSVPEPGVGDPCAAPERATPSRANRRK
jgi:uncharacterized protein YdhG (YjbR/CyaY superfamily)